VRGLSLKQGASGSAVVELQKKLKENNFSPGPIDGVFSEATETALMGFQKSAGLIPDGIAGSQTFAA